MEVGYCSDLRVVGRDEDGEAVVAQVFYAIVEFSSGRRFAHEVAFCEARYDVPEDADYEGPGFWVVEDDVAEAKVECLVARIEAAGEVDLEGHWSEVDPRYGSEAYEALDRTGYFLAMEKKAEEVA